MELRGRSELKTAVSVKHDRLKVGTLRSPGVTGDATDTRYLLVSTCKDDSASTLNVRMLWKQALNTMPHHHSRVLTCPTAVTCDLWSQDSCTISGTQSVLSNVTLLLLSARTRRCHSVPSTVPDTKRLSGCSLKEWASKATIQPEP